MHLKTYLKRSNQAQMTKNINVAWCKETLLHINFLCICHFRVDPARWWLKGNMPNTLANNIINLLQDMTAVSSNLVVNLWKYQFVASIMDFIFC